MKVSYTRLKLAGRQFGRLTVLRCAERAGKSGHRYWWASCTCGREVMVLGSDLKRGRTTSCGCLRAEVSGRQALALPRGVARRWVPFEAAVAP